MIRLNSTLFWLLVATIMALSFYFLRTILLPFVIGIAVAYFLDPVVDKLEERKWNRSLATLFTLFVFLALVIFLVFLLVPVLTNQLKNFAQFLPIVKGKLQLIIDAVAGILNNKVDAKVLDVPASGLIKWSTKMLGGVIDGGAAIADLLSLFLITPLVAFYLLRDWDLIVEKVYDWFPIRHKDTLQEQLNEIDKKLAAFVRGQGTVCLILASYYAITLTMTGLEFGVVIGVFAGLISFVPFVGAIFGGLLSIGLAYLQFEAWTNIVIIAGIFILGQILEGYILTPKFIGEAVGLHPVWVIFSLLAGGALFGFLGVLLALPMAAIVGVLFRFCIDHYKNSSYYNGSSEEN
ncbi:MAG: AI-2E family transporter [Pseudomonadota bacterium]|nr:AI-2E family transporter [Pseudomonadota bacterium]